MHATQLVGVFTVLLAALWLFSAVIHRKYHVRLQPILVVSAGFLALCTLFFVMFHMSRPNTCSFEGHAGPRITVPVHVGEAIDPLVLSPIPWNCFHPALRLSAALPRNITLQQHQQQHQQHDGTLAADSLSPDPGTQPVVAGTVVAPFDTVATEVTLTCSGLQTLSCGVLVLQACTAHTNASACTRNQCAWCADAAAPAGGTCGFCTAAFDAACWRATGTRAVCAAAQAWDDR